MRREKPFIFRYGQVEQVHLLRFQIEPYEKIWNLQRELQKEVIANRSHSYLILTQHNPVITLGKSGTYENLLLSQQELKKKKIQFFEIDRGGDITYHGPGQLVGYPILNLENLKKDIHWYLRTLEQIIMETLQEYTIPSRRIHGLTGVWIDNKKICAIGIKTTRWVTMHGFALNINTDLAPFQAIVPCGIQQMGITSIAEQVGNIIPLDEVITILLQKFSAIFGVKII
jgi:lipoyl(octanoyl) transferase